MKGLICAALIAAPLTLQAEERAEAIVSIGGPVTETIYMLGQQDRLAAVDTTSTYPDEVTELPNVGYMRALSPEGVLSLSPDLIVTRETAGPPEALDALHAARVPVIEIPENYDAEAVLQTVRLVGDALGEAEQAEELAAGIEVDLAKLSERVGKIETPRRVMFILSGSGGRLNVAGRGTGADGLIRLAGGKNVMADQFEGYKQVTDEAVLTADPEVIVMMRGREEHSGAVVEILSRPAIAPTSAGQNAAMILVDGAALGFGPRMAELAGALFEQLYPVHSDQNG